MLLYSAAAICIAAVLFGFVEAAKLGACSLVTTALVVLPFWIASPEGFTPFHVSGKGGGLLLIIIALALCLSWFLFGLRAAMRGRGVIPAYASMALMVAPLGFLVSAPSAIAKESWMQLGFAVMTVFLAPLAAAAS